MSKPKGASSRAADRLLSQENFYKARSLGEKFKKLVEAEVLVREELVKGHWVLIAPAWHYW